MQQAMSSSNTIKHQVQFSSVDSALFTVIMGNRSLPDGPQMFPDRRAELNHQNNLRGLGKIYIKASFFTKQEEFLWKHKYLS